LLGRLRSFFGGSSTGAANGATHQGQIRGRPMPPEQTRLSNGLDQFFNSLRDRQGLNLLDFAGANQSNVSYITSMGHRLSSEDFVRSLELTFGQETLLDNQSNPHLVDQFLQENLGFPYDSFDGALVWDSLQFLPRTCCRSPSIDSSTHFGPTPIFWRFSTRTRRRNKSPCTTTASPIRRIFCYSRGAGRIVASSSTIERWRSCSIATNRSSSSSPATICGRS